MGLAALYLKVSPAGFGLRPDHVRWPDLHADATQPVNGNLDLSVLSLPFPLIPISSRDLNLTSFARLSCIFDSFAVSVALFFSASVTSVRLPFHVSFLHIPSFRSFSPLSIISTISFRFLLQFPSRSDRAFACILASLHCPPQIRAIPLISISWISSQPLVSHRQHT